MTPAEPVQLKLPDLWDLPHPCAVQCAGVERDVDRAGVIEVRELLFQEIHGPLRTRW